LITPPVFSESVDTRAPPRAEHAEPARLDLL